jgi:hypothetical protein
MAAFFKTIGEALAVISKLMSNCLGDELNLEFGDVQVETSISDPTDDGGVEYKITLTGKTDPKGAECLAEGFKGLF